MDDQKPMTRAEDYILQHFTWLTLAELRSYSDASTETPPEEVSQELHQERGAVAPEEPDARP